MYREIICFVVVLLLACNGIRFELFNGTYAKIYITSTMTDWKNVEKYVNNNESYYLRLDPADWELSPYYENIEETVVSLSGKTEIPEGRQLVCLYLDRKDISKTYRVRIYDERENIIYEGDATTSKIKMYTGYFFTPYIKEAKCIELYDIATGKPIDFTTIYIYTVGNENSLLHIG